MASYHSGIDYFSSDIEKPVKTDVKCAACGTTLEGKKVHGPRSWVSAVGWRKTEHYSYLCPHSAHELHVRIVALLREQEDLVPEKLRGIVQLEINERRLELRKAIRKPANSAPSSTS